MTSFSITTLGCKVNQYDAAAVAELLSQAGLSPAPCRQHQADLVIVNTCCVTAAAMRKCRQAIRRAVRNSPGSAVVVLGCYSDYDRQGLLKLLQSLGVADDRAVVAGHHDDLAACLKKVAAERTGQAAAGAADDSGPACPDQTKYRRLLAIRRQAAATRNLPPVRRFPSHQRAFVKVQDGCDAFCSYCVVPYTRCQVWWRSIDDVEVQCRNLVAAGHREIVLCGVFLGAYGRPTAIRRRWRDLGQHGPSLAALVGRVAAIEGLWRVRLSSLEPGDLTDELLDLCRSTPTIAPHFHLPLQSGSDSILRRMNRQYAADEYRRTVDRLRTTLDRPAITTDIIVGFPGETEQDFRQTLALARHAGFAKIHAFPFSAIRGTAAWHMRRQGPAPQVVAERMAELARLETELAESYRQQFVGQRLQALVEQKRKGLWEATSERYLTIFCQDASARPGMVGTFEITHLHPEGLSGRLSDANISPAASGRDEGR